MLDQSLVTIRSGEIVNQADTDGQVLALWLHGRSKHTQRAYAAKAERFLEFTMKPLVRVSLGDVQAFADSLTELAQSSKAQTLAAIKSLLAFALDEWQDPKRVERLLGSNSPLAQCLREFFKAEGADIAEADILREDIKAVLTAKRDVVSDLKYPFVHDLVGNTICSDLIDYVKRDMYYCGLSETFGDRFIQYIAVFPIRRRSVDGEKVLDPFRFDLQTVFATRTVKEETEACRIVLMNYRYNERRVAVCKPDVFEEAIDLVRRRLAVAQKLYFHRTKMAASAMLAEAAVADGLTADAIWDLSDAEVLKKTRKFR